MTPLILDDNYYPSIPALYVPQQANTARASVAISIRAEASVVVPITTSNMTTTQYDNRPAVAVQKTHRASYSNSTSIMTATQNDNQRRVTVQQTQRVSQINSTSIMTATQNHNQQTVSAQQTHRSWSFNCPPDQNRFAIREPQNQRVLVHNRSCGHSQRLLVAGSEIPQQQTPATPILTPLQQPVQAASGFQLMPDIQAQNVGGIKRSRFEDEGQYEENVKREKLTEEEEEVEDTEMSDYVILVMKIIFVD
ncbi:hypothetical protein FPQ18DRAFT_304546 [Pyronema domesticum]|nr:hypothetical protein FPQ18DRAFT_304546 [Pyronema domesticum]